MVKYCPYCGKSVVEDAKFCFYCGHALPVLPVQNEGEGSAPQQESLRFSRNNTGTSLETKQEKKVHTVSVPAEADSQSASVQLRSILVSQVPEQRAAAAAGELDFGEFLPQELTDTIIEGQKLFSPAVGLIRGFGSFLGGAFRIFTKPAALFGTLLLAGLWFALSRFRDTDSEIIRILSWLTFSEGGYDRSAAGMIGGTLGKGTAAAALFSVFTGGIGKTFKGLWTLISGKGEKRGILGILTGVLIGAAAYLWFAGLGASSETAMAGIAGALLSLQAMGGENGKLYEMIRSLTSGKDGGARTERKGRCFSLLTGLALGFVLGTVLSVSGVLEVLQ